MIMRSAVLALIMSHAFVQGVEEYAPILGYELGPDVEDVMNLSRDLEAINKILENPRDQEQFDKAFNVYTHGGYSKTEAFLKLDEVLPWDIPLGTIIRGQAKNGEWVTLANKRDEFSGSALLEVVYEEIEAVCNVGGLPDDMIQSEGCLVSPGFLRVGNEDKLIGFQYDDVEGNQNDNSLYQLSKYAATNWRIHTDPANSYYKFFTKFTDYYGKAEFAHLTNEAIDQQGRFEFDVGHYDFTDTIFKSRADFFELITSYSVMGLNVIKELEEAVLDCKDECFHPGNCMKESVESMDDAVAYYVGHLQQEDGNGHLLYGLANQMCTYFKTCGEDGDSTEGTAKVNLDLFEIFNEMKSALKNAKCDAAKDAKNRASSLIMVPFVQGFIFNVYLREHEVYPEYTKDGALPFAAVVLPLLASCDMEEASNVGFDFVDYNLGEPKVTEKFNKIVHDIEDYYWCMDMCCADIGGLWNEDEEDYFEKRAPCVETRKECLVRAGLYKETGTGNKPAGKIIMVLILLAAIAISAVLWRRRSRNFPSSRRNENDGVDLEGRTIT